MHAIQALYRLEKGKSPTEQARESVRIFEENQGQLATKEDVERIASKISCIKLIDCFYDTNSCLIN